MMLDAHDPDEPEGDALTMVTHAVLALVSLEFALADAMNDGDTATADALHEEIGRMRAAVRLMRLLTRPSPDRPQATH